MKVDDFSLLVLGLFSNKWSLEFQLHFGVSNLQKLALKVFPTCVLNLVSSEDVLFNLNRCPIKMRFIRKLSNRKVFRILTVKLGQVI